MSYGFTAYESYVRIHAESGGPSFPGWTALPHVGRMAWEAAAQAVALAVLPAYLNPDPLEEVTEFDELPNDSSIVGERLGEPAEESETLRTATLPHVDGTL